MSGGSPGDRRVCLGAITGAHGIRGEVRIHCFASDPASLTAFGPLGDETGRRTFVVEGLRDANKGYIARIRGVTDRNAAEALRGTQLFIERDALPEPVTTGNISLFLRLIRHTDHSPPSGSWLYSNRLDRVENQMCAPSVVASPAWGWASSDVSAKPFPPSR